MRAEATAQKIDWGIIAIFVGIACVLSSGWAYFARERGMLANPQNAGFAASIAQLGVLIAALVTMTTCVRGGFRQVGWQGGPWTAYLKVFVVLMALVAVMAIPMVLGYQQPKGGTELPKDAGWVAIPFLLVFATVFAFAEEIGWRGFLLPQLLPLGAKAALIVSGLLWFCWEAPLVWFGLLDSTLIRVNLPLTLACHFASTVAMAVVFGYLRLRFGSVWLPTFAHGMLNALGGVSYLFMTESNPIWSDFGGPIGTVLTVIVAVAIWRQVGRDVAAGVLPIA